MGSTATLSGTGYTAGKTVATSNVTIAGSALTITTQTVAANGTWWATFTVPNSSAGAQTITATDSGSDSASTTFTVNAAPQRGNPPAAPSGHDGATLRHRLHRRQDGGDQQRDHTPVRQPHHHYPDRRLQRHLVRHLHRAEQPRRGPDHHRHRLGQRQRLYHLHRQRPTPVVAPTSGTVGSTGATLTGTGYIAGKTVATATCP